MSAVRLALVPRPAFLERACLESVAYGDLFDYPLSTQEIHRYLPGERASLEAVERMVAHLVRCGRLETVNQLHTLPGRLALAAIRLRRTGVAATLWPAAERYGRAIARVPFVRMVAVTGALAIDNVEPQADIDYLIVTEPGRLWLCRALVIAVVRRAARQGVVLCPNYFLSERAVALNDHSLFTAHELLQMVPVAGPETYRQMIAANAWSTTFLPNARPLAPLSGVAVEAVPPGEIGRRRPTMVRDLEPSRWRTMAESLARLPPGGMVDRWEMRRKLRRFAARGITAEVAFNADCCKGHFEGHGQRIMAAYQERLRGI